MFHASHPQIHIIELSIKYPKLGVFVLVLPNLERKSKVRMKTITHEQKKVCTKQVLLHQTGFVA
jgi:DNA topoisomerase IB